MNQPGPVITLCNKIYTKKTVCCWKKHGRIVYNIHLLLPMRLIQILRNGHCYVISKYSSSHEAIVQNGGCIKSHNKPVEQTFYIKYTGK